MKKPGLTFVRPGAKVLQFTALRLEDELQCVLNLPVAVLACELRLSELAPLGKFTAALNGDAGGGSSLAVSARGIHYPSSQIRDTIVSGTSSVACRGVAASVLQEVCARCYVESQVCTVKSELGVIKHVEHFQAKLQL